MGRGGEGQCVCVFFVVFLCVLREIGGDRAVRVFVWCAWREGDQKGGRKGRRDISAYITSTATTPQTNTTSYLIISHHITLYHTISHRIISHLIISYYITSYHIKPHRTVGGEVKGCI